MHPVGRFIYARQCRRQPRSQSTATKFFRNIEQLVALEGPLHSLVAGDSVNVLVAGCSMGCEAFTIAGFLAEKYPKLDWRIVASDISGQALDVARRGTYAPEHGLGENLSPLANKLEDRLFQRNGDCWQIRENISARVTFEYGDVLVPSFRRYQNYDLVFGQNFMIHMSPTDSEIAFGNLVGAARTGGALFLGGMDLDSRPKLIAKHGLEPINWRIDAIHDGDGMRRSAWPWQYWALEPVNSRALGWAERYCTIFLKREQQAVSGNRPSLEAQ